MSVRVLAWALRDAPVTNRTDLLVLIAIADHAHDDGTGAYPSVGTLARMARCSPRSVESALARLQASGVLAIEERAGKTSMYRVLTTPAASAGVTPADGCRTPRSSRHQPPQLTTPTPAASCGRSVKGTVRTVRGTGSPPLKISIRKSRLAPVRP